MKFIFRTLAIISAVVMIFSCSQKTEGNYSDIELESFNAWMKAYKPNAEKLGEHMYIEKLYSSPETAPKVEMSDWLMISYTGTDLHGNVYRTRYAEEAKIQGKYKLRTRYIPELTQIYDPNYNMIKGQYEALKTMREGDSVRIYMPSSYTYGASGYSGTSDPFGGQIALRGSVPSILTLKLEEIIKDMEKHEEQQVENYAKNVWKLTDADTIVKLNYFARTRTENTIDSLIPKDTTVNIYYVGKFLDGFIFDTNIDSIALKSWNEIITSTPLKIKSGDSNAGVVQAFKDVIPKMNYNEWGKMVFISKYGYGANKQSGTTIIPPYSPLIFEFYVQKIVE